MHPKKWGSETPLEGSVHTDPWRSTAMCYPTKRYSRLKRPLGATILPIPATMLARGPIKRGGDPHLGATRYAAFNETEI